MQDKKKAAPVKGSDVKRTRRDRGELEDIMFKLFERQPNWALKQLVQETDQPAVHTFHISLNMFSEVAFPFPLEDWNEQNWQRQLHSACHLFYGYYHS